MKRAEPFTVRATLRALGDQLATAGLESPAVEAERLVAHVLGVSRASLALEADRPLPPEAAATLARLAGRRAEGVPLQHLEGSVAFRDLVLRADARALLPRPETEQLLDLVARDVRASGVRSRKRGGGVRTVRRPDAAPAIRRALDVGTGSGAIALSLVHERLAERVVALDVSAGALEQAAENRATCGIAPEAVELRLCVPPDPFRALRDDERFGLLVSNPPYVPSADLAGLPREVRDHEPRAALDGGADGLALVRVIASRAPGFLDAGASAWLEIGEDQGEAAGAAFEAADEWVDVRVHDDLSGRVRFLHARRRGSV